MPNKLLFKTPALLLCLLSILNCFAQNKKITGTVSDERGNKLQGVSVSIKNTPLMTATNADGNFTLNAPGNSKTLVFSFVGMEQQEIAISGRFAFSIVLKALPSTLSDMVIIGYGSVRKTDVTGAVQRISREDLTRDVPTNVLQALQGKMAGVNVTQNDGAPGAGISIRVRGSNSFLGGTEPLYVIDGVPFNNSSSGSTPGSIGEDEKQTINALAFLDPNDVESIDVLKDASATAIYGSRGANGVVIITTRKGRSGRDKVELNLNIGVSEVTKKLHMLKPYDYAAYRNLSYANANKYDGTNYAVPYPDLSIYEGDNKLWQDEIFRRGVYQQYSAAVSGGTDAGSHKLSVNYINQDGPVKNSDFKKLGISLNLNRNLGKMVKIGTSTAVSSSINNGVKTGTDKSDAASAGVIRSALTFPPTISTVDEYSNSGEGYFITNPVIYVNDVLNKIAAINIFSSNYMEVKLTRDLRFRQNLGFNYGSNSRDQYYPRTVYEGAGKQGWGLKANSVWSSLVSESILSYSKKLNKHSLDLTGASTYERTNGQSRKDQAQTFPNDVLKNENLEAAETIMPITGSRYQSTLISFLGRINYGYDDRYLLSFSYRRDGSSKFGKDNKWAGFSSAGVAWKVHNESFLKNNKTIDELVFRLSYGQTGNQGIGSYASLSKLTVYNYPFDGAVQTGLADDVYSGPANSLLKWEITNAYNAGMDLAVMKGLFNVHVDAYLKRTNDLLQYITTPASTGFERKLINSGEVENKGLEISLEANIIRKKNLQWKSGFNISFNRNKILSLGEGLTTQFAGNISTGDAPFIQTVGKPIGTLYGYVEDGYYDNEAEVRSSPQYINKVEADILDAPGEIKYRNFDGDPTAISATDRTFIGDVNPRYTFGFINNFTYKNLDLSVFINGVQGNDVINMNTRFNANVGTSKNISEEALAGAWAEGKDNSQATGPKAIQQFWRTILFTRRFIEDGSFVRIKNITLGYTLPGKLIKGVSSIRLSLGVNNLYTFTNYSGFDPEINSYGDNPALFGVDLGGYPNSRTCNFTVRCNF